MGKGKGKKGKKEPRSAANKVPQAAKVRAPRPVNPVKKAKKLLSKEKKAGMNIPPLGADMDTINQLAQDRIMRNLVHAKWPALFKKHMGVIESHIQALDRVMSSMRTQMDQMSKKERMEWELGERGNYRVICEMMDRARQVLVDTKKCAEGILPPERLKDKKGLGVTGTTFEPLGPKLAEKAVALGYTKRGKLGRNPDATSTDSDDDTDISDSFSSKKDADAVTNGADFVPLNIGAKVPRFPTVEESGEDKEKTTTNGVEPNPYFVVDTNPTPVVLKDNGILKSKKRAKEDDVEEKTSKIAKEKHTVSEVVVQPLIESEVDFAAVEATLQAEVAAAEAAKAQEAQLAESFEDKKSKKKRRRSSDGEELAGTKKVKKSKKVEDAPAADTTGSPIEESTAKEAGKKRKISETAPGDDVIEKKLKKDKKGKKRKADGEEAEDDHGKKKRKQKVVTE